MPKDGLSEAPFLFSGEDVSDCYGHRERLRERFLTTGPESLQDHELLEFVLFSAIKRSDTKPIAKALIKRFGSFGEVLSASPEQLQQVKGVGEVAALALKGVQAAAQRLLQTKVKGQPVISSWNDLINYCTAQMAYNAVEQFRVLYLDRKNRLITDEAQAEGTVDHTPVYPREVAKRALELNASACILCHIIRAATLRRRAPISR